MESWERHETLECKCLQINPVRVELISTNENVLITITMLAADANPSDTDSTKYTREMSKHIQLKRR